MAILTSSAVDLADLLLGQDADDTVFTDEELIPVRMLNEFTYCPRLAYLEWVQGEFTDNLDTREGTFGHRNVDRPSARPIPAPTEFGDVPPQPAAVPIETSTSNPTATTSITGAEPSPPSIEPATTAASSPLLKTRSLTLSAAREGLVAKLDLLELDGQHVTPVEYKKGAIPDNPFQAWEPERVQLCAQGLILRENGYQCNAGEIFYIESRHRVTVPFDDALVLRTRELIRQLREMGRGGQIPSPLVDSPKCPRCSLVGICLPDETNLLLRDAAATGLDASTRDSRAGSPDEDGSASTNSLPSPVRHLLPARDDALPLYVKEQGAFVGKDADRLVVRHRTATLISVPLIDVSQVSLFGNVQMSSQALREVVDRGISVCHFSYGGWFAAMTTGHVHKNIELRMAQFATAADPVKSLELAKSFIVAKIRNGRTMLRRHATAQQRSGQTDTTSEPEIDLTDETASPRCVDAQKGSGTSAGWPVQAPAANQDVSEAPSDNRLTQKPSEATARELAQLAEWARMAGRATSAETLLGLEGMAAKVYFSGFARLLKGGHAFDFSGRNRRPPRDPINALLSFVYSLLAKELTIAVRSVGFDPLLGFFHKPRYGRPSLALDLAEEFRPLIGDSTVLMLVNNGEISESSFLARAGAVTLTEPGRKAVIAAFERRMEQEITHPIFGYRISYRRVLQVQARLLSRVLLGELASYPGFCTR
ncbi:CRISPR-associated endonuclease Cas1 [Schlesneria sp. DSM 10557]|uniref:CRISPR-associated endonuclease Cas1 n=1 Tax=Schlesneria sp. DSM 10557 TaxID=3044399 RepID=UPI00359F7AD5